MLDALASGALKETRWWLEDAWERAKAREQAQGRAGHPEILMLFNAEAACMNLRPRRNGNSIVRVAPHKIKIHLCGLDHITRRETRRY